MTLTHNRADLLREEFPGWLIGEWRSGGWWAWKKLTHAQWRARCRGYFQAGDADELAEMLMEQTAAHAAVTE